jgi:uncharacterized membrane protein (DUF485 family)
LVRRIASLKIARHPLAMTKTTSKSISELSAYKKLTKTRWRLALSLTFVELSIYYGFIYLVAFHKDLMSLPIDAGKTTWSIALGISVIVMTVIVTGIYVTVANSKFDKLTQEIHNQVQS